MDCGQKRFRVFEKKNLEKKAEKEKEKAKEIQLKVRKLSFKRFGEIL